MSGQHAQKPKRSKTPFVIAAAVVSLCVAGTGVFLLTSRSTDPAVTATPTDTPFAVLASTPTNAATVDSSAAIRVALSSPLASSSPMPTLSPSVPGSWQRLSPTTIEYVQDSPVGPGQSVTITVPGGASGLKSANGKFLASSITTTFHTAPLSTLRVQQLLAQLGYLPVTFTPAAQSSTPGIQTAEVPGTFSNRWSTLPESLTSQWQAGAINPVTKGAIMRFQDVHNMKTDGIAGPALWDQLLADAKSGKNDPNPYNYVIVAKNLPQKLTLYSNGEVVYTSVISTGIAGEETPSGTFPVYQRYRTQTMRGTNPDGSEYVDPGIPWISYFYGGDALHGFLRSSYGFPQSLGCVEMPFANAEVVWPQTPLGTLVTVQ